MTGYSYSLLIMILLMLFSNMGECQYIQDSECGAQRCGIDGPPIRFPFRLKDKEPPGCGYPGFDLTCNHKNDTLFEISAVPVPIKFHVYRIGYEYNYFSIFDPQNCLPNLLLKLINASISPFQFKLDENSPYNISFFNCSQYNSPPCRIYVADDTDTLLNINYDGVPNILSCTKMLDISSTFHYASSVQFNSLDLLWSKPDCSKCERKGKHCKLKNNSTEGEVVCFNRHHKRAVNIKVLVGVTGVVIGSILLLLLGSASFKISHYFRMKGEDQARIEKFLEDYRALKPTRFSYADIKRISNGFKEKLGEGAHGAVFKGELSADIIVAVKILNNTDGEGKDFTNEVGTMGKIHHVNVVRLLGFCAEGFHRALVYDFFPRGSLNNFISTPDNKDIFLGWEKLQEIALGVGRGIEYLHQGCEQQILHFDINPYNVLLDDKFIPKITDFGLAKLCSKNQSAVSMTAARGTLGYIAPEVVSRNFGNVSYKSDIYSYGMLLLEMVGGKKNTEMTIEGPFRILYPEWVHNLVDGGDVQLYIEDDEDIKIAKKIAIVGLRCIQWQPSHRPSIKTVIHMLEGDGDKLTALNNPFDTATSARNLNLELEAILE